jgi:hypothetical protein
VEDDTVTALAADNTQRFKVFYTNNGQQHTIESRPDATGVSTFDVDMDALFTAMSPLLYNTVIDDVQYAAAGSNIFNPISSALTSNTYGGGGSSPNSVPTYIGFVGRSPGGHRWRTYFFGVNAVGGNYRFTAGENSDIDAAVAALNAAPHNFLAIDGVKPVYRSYANAGINYHWMKEIR